VDFSQISVLCVGDVMLDRFVHGHIERISPEAPVPVIRTDRTKEMLGGTGNVASNIASLGGRATLVGLVGVDSLGSRSRALASEAGRITPAFVDTVHRPTICKTRFIAGRQQVVRADEESTLPLQPAEEASLIATIDAHLVQAGALILSDYGKGVLSRAVIAHAIASANARGVPVFVDPKNRDFSLYRGATCITPNLKELALASGMPVGTEEEVVAAARRVLADAEAQAILATRSEKGMMLVERSGEVHSVPARAREVFDVSGAGDTVIATLTLAVASGRSLAQAMHIANAAAGVVVSKLGTATADIAEVLHELAEQEAAEQGTPVAGLQSLPRVKSLVSRWKEQGLTVGFTNGCYDILHPGHVSLLAAARAACDRLVVALNTDESVRRLKGPTRPVNGLEQRAQVMAAIRHVDCVVGFDQDTPLQLIEELLPDVLVKGADYTIDKVVGADVVHANGGRVVLVDLVEGQSTTGTIARMRLLDQQATAAE
jgi:D-beta-D-heptose 7-phosphate kinase / D-beta-D-heptose 1-phosphate adenosyltransferase